MIRRVLPVIPVIRVLLSISPLLFGVITALTLYYNYDDSSSAISAFNMHTWNITVYSPFPYALLHMMLISNLVIVIFGTFVYIWDISAVFPKARVHPKSWMLLLVLLSAMSAVFACGIWILLYVTANILTSAGSDAGNLIATMINKNDIFAIIVFSLFLFGDLCLCHFYGLCREHYVELKDSESVQMFSRCWRFAKDSIYMIDIPVLLGSVLLMILTLFALPDPRFGGLGPKLTSTFSHYSNDYTMTLLDKYLPNVFAGGFFLGAIICQLTYSQIVLAVLTVRVKSAGHGEIACVATTSEEHLAER